jgi:hypothetical protein
MLNPVVVPAIPAASFRKFIVFAPSKWMPAIRAILRDASPWWRRWFLEAWWCCALMRAQATKDYVLELLELLPLRRVFELDNLDASFE